MSWLEVIKKNADKVIDEKKEVKVEEEEEVFDIKKLEEYRDFDDEFEINYGNEVMDIKVLFMELIEEYGFPLMNSRDSYMNPKNSFIEFMKRNTDKGDLLKYECEQFNEELRIDYLNASDDDEFNLNVNETKTKKDAE